MKARTRGFTLVELLVVIAIIITLLAILLPSMGRAIHVARMTQCLSNTKQAGLGMVTFAADNFGRFIKHDFNKPTLLKEGAIDIRPAMKSYVAFNELACPFTEPINYVDPPLTSGAVEWTYIWLAGWSFAAEPEWMSGPGATVKNGDYRINVLVCDQLWTLAGGPYPHSSHPGRGMGMRSAGANTGGVPTELTYDANAWTFYRYDNPAANFSAGGEVDLNYLFTDLSGRSFYGVDWAFNELTPLPFFRTGNTWFQWMPTK